MLFIHHQEEDRHGEDKGKEKNDGRRDDVRVQPAKGDRDDGVENLVLDHGHVVFLLHFFQDFADEVAGDFIEPHIRVLILVKDLNACFCNDDR